MHGFTVYPFLGSSIRKDCLFIRFLIYFKVSFNQAFLTSVGNMVTSVKLLGYGMNWDTSETDSPKSGNEFLNSFTTTLNTLCRTLPILFVDNYAPFH